MSLQSWARQLWRASAPPDIIDLHIRDTVAALLVGIRTREGRALAQLYGRRAELAERVAAAAIARLSECDDIHLASCVTPGSVVIPVALAFAGTRGIDDVNRAIAAGYSAGLSLGLGIGGTNALAAGVWPSLVATPLMAAVTVSRLSGGDPDRLAHAMALSLAGAGGRLGRPTGSRTGRWFVFAEAVAKGIRAAEAAGQGFQGDLTLLSKSWLQAQAGHEAVDMNLFASPSPVPSISDVGFKPFPIARQGANAVAAFQRVLSRGLDPRRIDAVEVFVPAMNVALLSRTVADDDRLSRLSSMGFQLACAAFAPELLYETERLPSASFLDFAHRVNVAPAGDLETHLPDHWPARVVVTMGGERLEETILRHDFDCGTRDLLQHLREKWRRLLPAEDGAISGNYAELWQRIERRVTMADTSG
jgi:2-methylcitrate dehydratase PrpD